MTKPSYVTRARKETVRVLPSQTNRQGHTRKKSSHFRGLFPSFVIEGKTERGTPFTHSAKSRRSDDWNNLRRMLIKLGYGARKITRYAKTKTGETRDLSYLEVWHVNKKTGKYQKLTSREYHALLEKLIEPLSKSGEP